MTRIVKPHHEIEKNNGQTIDGRFLNNNSCNSIQMHTTGNLNRNQTKQNNINIINNYNNNNNNNIQSLTPFLSLCAFHFIYKVHTKRSLFM